eukprot:s78_g26.t1
MPVLSASDASFGAFLISPDCHATVGLKPAEDMSGCSSKLKRPCGVMALGWGCTIQPASDECADKMKSKPTSGPKRKNPDVPDALQTEFSAIQPPSECAAEMKSKPTRAPKRKNLDAPDALQVQFSAVENEFPDAAPAEQGQHGFILTKGHGVYLDLFSGSCRLASASASVYHRLMCFNYVTLISVGFTQAMARQGQAYGFQVESYDIAHSGAEDLLEKVCDDM